MVRRRTRKGRRAGRPATILKPRGTFHNRVQKAGPEHFGIVSIDCAKARSKWMLADFYGTPLVDPTVVAHNRGDLDAAIARLREAIAAHGINDLLVAVERTGRYHHIVQRAFAAAGFEVRIVHPFATKQFRQPANPGNKTDDTDLAAIHRAAVNGFALLQSAPGPDWLDLQLFERHRRDLVQKSSALCCQIKEHLNVTYPGYAACFDNVWKSSVALPLIRKVDSADQMQTLGVAGLTTTLREAEVRFQERTLHTILAWAATAASSETTAPTHRRIALALDDDRRRKAGEIQALERNLAARLSRTPYVLLLSIPGINVVSAAEYAGEMGPITGYANAKTITGRAGLYPSRSQSDEVDAPNGPLVRCANRHLRFAIMQIADNLAICNKYFAGLARHWKATGKDPRHTRVKIGCRFCRIAYQMVAGQRVFQHPAARERSWILQKLMAFHCEHLTPMDQMLADLQAAAQQVPPKARAAEAVPLAGELKAIQEGRRRGPQPIGEILPIVLAQLGVASVQSTASGERITRAAASADESRTP